MNNFGMGPNYMGGYQYGGMPYGGGNINYMAPKESSLTREQVALLSEKKPMFDLSVSEIELAAARCNHIHPNGTSGEVVTNEGLSHCDQCKATWNGNIRTQEEANEYIDGVKDLIQIIKSSGVVPLSSYDIFEIAPFLDRLKKLYEVSIKSFNSATGNLGYQQGEDNILNWANGFFNGGNPYNWNNTLMQTPLYQQQYGGAPQYNNGYQQGYNAMQPPQYNNGYQQGYQNNAMQPPQYNNGYQQGYQNNAMTQQAPWNQAQNQYAGNQGGNNISFSQAMSGSTNPMQTGNTCNCGNCNTNPPAGTTVTSTTATINTNAPANNTTATTGKDTFKPVTTKEEKKLKL